MKALAADTVNTSGTFVIQQDFDNKYAITNLAFVKTMLGMSADAYGAAEIALSPAVKPERVQASHLQTSASVPPEAFAPGNLAAVVETVERHLIATTLDRTRGNISESARVLGLTRRGLYLKIRRLGLEGGIADI